jgi:flagellar basal body-associated protein FliL
LKDLGGKEDFRPVKHNHSWWILIIVMGIVFFILGRRNLQIGDFKVFILIFFLTVGIALFIFWFFSARKDPK